mgnify:CR=1 FL=1|jgi:hypothetical protein
MVMKYLSMLLLSVILLTSCNSPTCSCNEEGGDAPKLKVTNLACDNITSVSLVGYDFQNLLIGLDESKTFTLADGFPSGLENVNINVSGYNSGVNRGFNKSISVNFVAGQTTFIKAVLPSTATFCDMGDVTLELDE